MPKGISLNTDGKSVKLEDGPNGPCVAGIEHCRHSDNYKCLISNNKYAFQLSKCPINKWTAMKIYKTEEQTFSSWPPGACFTCGSTEFWNRPSGPSVCAICHPQMEDKKWRSTMTFSSKSKKKSTTARSSKSSKTAQESVFSTQNDDSL